MSILSKLDQTRTAAWRETVHDLQGGLGLVTLASTVLDREDLSEPARLEFSDLVQRGVSSLRDMLNDFMSLTRLDASLELETGPGKGTTFRVILPRWYEAGGKP